MLRFSTKPSIFGAVMLLSGSCIGAGMLSLPIVTGIAGFLPSTVAFLLVWLLMTASAVLVVEMASALPEEEHMAGYCRKTLGNLAAWSCSFSYISLFYCLLVAYIFKSGQLLSGIFPSLNIFFESFPALLVTIFSALVLSFGTRLLDRCNSLFMTALFLSYFLLMGSGTELLDFSRLKEENWSLILYTVPFLTTSFGFHNMIPSLHKYFSGNSQKLLHATLIASFVPFTLYYLWCVKMYASLPLNGEVSIVGSFYLEEIATEPFAKLIHNDNVQFLALFFSLFAIITSVFGQSLSLKDFILDSFQIERSEKKQLLTVLCIFAPAFVLSQTSQGIFFQALEIAGGMAAIFLFGLLPPLIVRQTRKKHKAPFWIGGNFSLQLLLYLSLFIFIFVSAKSLGFIAAPQP